MTFFEVDHPATQADKRDRLSSVGADAKDVRFVSVDFRQDSVTEQLATAGHDAETATHFMCEGVTSYVPRRELATLVDGVAGRAGTGSSFAIDFVTSGTDKAFIRRLMLRVVRAGTAILGERVVTVLDPAAVEELLRSAGWSEVQLQPPAGPFPALFAVGVRGEGATAPNCRSRAASFCIRIGRAAAAHSGHGRGGARCSPRVVMTSPQWAGDATMSRCETARPEMSNVTNVLILATWERDAMDALTNSARRWEDTAPWRGYFGSISRQPAAEFWGDDGKWPECDVWAGAFNHLNRPALLAELQELPWEKPASVQILIRGQDDDCWGLWMFVDGRLVEVDLPGVVRLPLKANVRGQGQFVDVDVGMLLRRPPPTSSSVPCNASVYGTGGAWHFVIYADGLETAVAGILPVAGNAAVESAQAAAVATLRERFGVGYDIVWRFERNGEGWWGDIATATA